MLQATWTWVGRCGCAAAVMLAGAGCGNDPYRAGEAAAPTFFGVFATPPTKLDPTSAYYVHEGQIIAQIYEPPFTYHYLRRPYELIPLTARAVPEPVYRLDSGEIVAPEDVAAAATAGPVRVEYTIHLRDDVAYQDHPCFARDADGRSPYRDIAAAAVRRYGYPSRMPHQATRRLSADDYLLQIRRLADPRLASPVFSTLAAYILGFRELQEAYTERLESLRAERREAAGPGYNQEQDERLNPLPLDYAATPFAGAERIDDLTFRITLSRPYPQLLYWMAMHFFAPIPQEALAFYAIPAIAAEGWSLNRCPVGTGPYTLDTFRPNEVMVLVANPNYHDDTYPEDGEPGDREAGLLDDAGRRLPMITRQVYRMEREAIPAWNKFLQGYVDASGIAGDVFDQAIVMRGADDVSLSPAMAARGIRLLTNVRTMFWYTGFNMLDDLVGYHDADGAVSLPARYLRQAVSIALDYNEFLDIFQNGRGITAQGPIPPGIFGYRSGPAGTNPYTDTWDPVRGRHVRLPLDRARELLVKAGYPDGLGPDGRPLTLHFDHAAGVDPSFRSYFQWMRDRLALIGVRLVERGTDLSRFREKRDQGNWQLSGSGWLADYPDPENFLFLFYGPNSVVSGGGANVNNYAHPEYDALFRQMESMPNGPARAASIDAMVEILRRDAPSVWQYHPVSYTLLHPWYRNVKPHEMSYNVMKYRRIDPDLRVARQHAWNRPRWRPVAGAGALVLLVLAPGIARAIRRERHV